MTTESDSKPKYESGEKLLCFHGPLLYEAKCLDVKVKDGQWMYFVHYQGWNKNWDEWVTDKRMFKFNEEGLRKQKELEHQIKSGKKVKILRKSDLKKQSLPPPEIMEEIEQTLRPIENRAQPETKEPEETPKVKVKKSLEPTPNEEEKHVEKNGTSVETIPTETTITSQVKTLENAKPTRSITDENAHNTQSSAIGRRRKSRAGFSDVLVENDEGFLTAPQLKVELPSSLKAWLVDDWDLITRQARLYELPASHPISSLMVDFLQHQQRSADADPKPEPPMEGNNSEPPNQHVIVPHITSDLRHEFVAGLQHYFNQILGSQLLYKFERLQYAEVLKHHTDKRMSDIYGPMHLLRLFVKLREMVSCTRVDSNSLPLLESLISELILFLHNNRMRYFRIEDYTVATAEYQRRSMC